MKGNYRLKRFSDRELLGRPLTGQQKSELLALMDRHDDDIDTSDIAEVRELPPGTRRGAFQSNRSVQLTEELHAYFSASAARKGVPLVELINDVLSKEMAIVEAVK
jgi:hypothetical protein